MLESKRLYRSREDRMVAGVCGGLGEYLGIDPTIVRLIFALTFLFAGGGLVIYIVMALLVPEEPLGSEMTSATVVEEAPKSSAKPKTAAKKKTASKKSE